MVVQIMVVQISFQRSLKETLKENLSYIRRWEPPIGREHPERYCQPKIILLGPQDDPRAHRVWSLDCVVLGVCCAGVKTLKK